MDVEDIRHVRKKTLQFLVPLRLFCGFSCAFLMISGKPSSKCQSVWLQIKRTFDTSIFTELKGLISYLGMLWPARLLMRGSRNFGPENFKFARFWEGDPAFSRWPTCHYGTYI